MRIEPKPTKIRASFFQAGKACNLCVWQSVERALDKQQQYYDWMAKKSWEGGGLETRRGRINESQIWFLAEIGHAPKQLIDM